MPPYIIMDHCADWSSDSNSKFKLGGHKNKRRSPSDFFPEPYSSSASFDLPLSSDRLFVFSRGAAAGFFKLVQSPDLDPNEGVARVAVVARYRRPSALQHVKVCSVTRGETESGVGIFVSVLSYLAAKLRFYW